MKRADFGFSPPGRMLFRFPIDAETMRQRYGAPHYGENGPRGMAAWGFEFEDGTTFELHFKADDNTCYVNGDLRDIGYLIERLEVEGAFDRLDDDEDHYLIAMEEHFPSWRTHEVVAANDTVVRTPSPRHAAWAAERVGGSVQLADDAEIQMRKARVAEARSNRSKRPQPPVRAVSSDGTWELWRTEADGGRSLVGVFEDRAKAEAIMQNDPDRHELRPRAAPPRP